MENTLNSYKQWLHLISLHFNRVYVQKGFNIIPYGVKNRWFLNSTLSTSLFTLNENETRVLSALWLVGAKEPTN